MPIKNKMEYNNYMKIYRQNKKLTVIPNDVIPNDVIPEDVIPEDVIPEDVIPEDVIPEDVIPNDVIPEDVIPEDVIPNDVIPEDVIPEDVIPEDVIPEDVIPVVNKYAEVKHNKIYRRLMRELIYQSKFLSWDKVLNEFMDLYPAYSDNKIFKNNHRKLWGFIMRELKKLKLNEPKIPVKKITKIITVRNNSNSNSDFMLWVYKNNKVVADMNQYHM